MILGRAVSMIRIKCIRVTDERVKKMNEILSYIKLIKMYAWEKPFMKTIAGKLSERDDDDDFDDNDDKNNNNDHE